MVVFPDRSGHIDRGVDSGPLLSIYGLVDEGVVYLLNPNPIQSSMCGKKINQNGLLSTIT